MIVPSNRLLLWAALCLPFIALAVAEPSVAFVAGAVPGLLLVAAILDAAAAWGRLDGLAVQAPEITRLSKDRDGLLSLRIDNEPMKLRRVRIGLAFPDDLWSERVITPTALPADSRYSVLTWPLKGLQRGRYFLDRAWLECASPLQLWSMRAGVPLNAEIRVYPNIFPERRNLAALFLGRGLAGIHPQRQVGKGRDFEKLREYSPGDSYEDVYWKGTAKRGFPITKIFQVERTQEVYVVIDASRLSARPAYPDNVPEDGVGRYRTTVLERFVTSALIVGLAAERQGDLFGLLTFSDKVHGFVRAKNGKTHYDSCREALYTLQPRGVTPDFAELFTFISARLRRRSLLVFLTSMDDPVLAESFARDVHLIARRHLVLVNMIRPPAARPLFSHTGVEAVDDLYTELGGHFLWRGLQETRKVLKEQKADFNLLDSEAMCTELVAQYLTVKQRQIL